MRTVSRAINSAKAARPPIAMPAILPAVREGVAAGLALAPEVLAAPGVYVTVLMTEWEGLVVSESFSASDAASRVREAEAVTIVGASVLSPVGFAVDAVTVISESRYSGRKSISPISGHWLPCLHGSDSQQPMKLGEEE